MLEEMEHTVEYSYVCEKRSYIKKGMDSLYTCRKNSSNTLANVWEIFV